MKVLFCQPTMQYTGSENSLYQILSLVKEDYDAYLLYGQDGPFLNKMKTLINSDKIYFCKSTKLKRNISVLVEFLYSFYSTFMYFRKHKIKNEFSFVVINTLMFPQVYIACRLLGIKAITICRENKKTYGFIPFFIYSSICVFCSYKIILLFENQKKYFSLSFFNKNFNVIPNTITELHPLSDKEFSYDHFNILCVMGMSLRKGVFDLFEIANYLHDSFDTRFTLTLVGKTDTTIISEFKIKYPHLIERIKFIGTQNDTSPFYEKADVFLHPSHTEALPRVILEAINFGLPVVATNVGGTDTMVKEGINGSLFQPQDVKIASNHLIKIANDHSLRRKYSEASLKIFNNEFSPLIVRKKILEVIK